MISTDLASKSGWWLKSPFTVGVSKRNVILPAVKGLLNVLIISLKEISTDFPGSRANRPRSGCERATTFANKSAAPRNIHLK